MRPRPMRIRSRRSAGSRSPRAISAGRRRSRKTGDTSIVIDLLTQRFYVYRGEQLVGMSTISSGKKGSETPLGFWSVMTQESEGLQPQI